MDHLDRSRKGLDDFLRASKDPVTLQHHDRPQPLASYNHTVGHCLQNSLL